MGGEQGNFVIQLTPELIRQLIDETSEPKPPPRRRRRSSSKAVSTGGDDKPSLPFGMPPPLFPLGFPPALRHPEDGDKQDDGDKQESQGFEPQKELNVEPSKEEPDQQKPDQAVVSRNLQPLIDVLQTTEKFSEELHKRSVEELEELKQRSEELREKHHYDSPPRTVPCVAERDECIKCYKEGDPLRCSSVAAAYIQCAMKALRGQ